MKITENKKKKGISLIVLIVTIAVIIILATAVILSITNNRPIESAKDATTSHNESVLLESATVLSAQWKTDSLLSKTGLSRSEYVKEGLKSQGFTAEEVGDMIVDEETGKVAIKGGAIDVASNPEKYYGATITNYTESSNSKVGWKILYSDSSNIYLIADDYIPYDSIPNSTENGSATSNKPNTGDTSYTSTAYFTNILQDYTGSMSITESKIQNLNSKYFEYLKSNNKQNKQYSMKAVAYMLDTKAWKKFKGEKADYAIGGPTLEIFIKSWNAKYKDAKIEYQVADVGSDYKALNGYTHKKAGTTDYTTYIIDAFRKSDSSYDDLYVIRDTSKAYSMWLASTSGHGATYLGYVDCIGYLGDQDYYYGGSGFRPLVCLKSSVKLEEQSFGKYAIK